jgi:hypothetical protein
VRFKNAWIVRIPRANKYVRPDKRCDVMDEYYERELKNMMDAL